MDPKQCEQIDYKEEEKIELPLNFTWVPKKNTTECLMTMLCGNKLHLEQIIRKRLSRDLFKLIIN